MLTQTFADVLMLYAVCCPLTGGSALQLPSPELIVPHRYVHWTSSTASFRQCTYSKDVSGAAGKRNGRGMVLNCKHNDNSREVFWSLTSSHQSTVVQNSLYRVIQE